MDEAALWKDILTKAQMEYDDLLLETKALPLQEIIDRAYEIIMKADILTMLQTIEFDNHVAVALQGTRYPLATLYAEWLSNDYSSNDLIIDTINGFAMKWPQQDCCVEVLDVEGDMEL